MLTPYLLPPYCPATGDSLQGLPVSSWARSQPQGDVSRGSILLNGEHVPNVPTLPKTSSLLLPGVTQTFTELQKGPSYMTGPGEEEREKEMKTY